MPRISKIIKELNISISTLNEELSLLSLPVFNINSKVSDEDANFIIDFFNSSEIAKIDELRQQIAKNRIELKKFFLKRNKSPKEMGLLEKMQLFNYINSKEQYTKTKPKLKEYTEDNFWELINWFDKWNKMTDKEKSEAEKEKTEVEEDWFDQLEEQKIFRDDNVIDEESAIMSALANGDGDAFGF